MQPLMLRKVRSEQTRSLTPKQHGFKSIFNMFFRYIKQALN